MPISCSCWRWYYQLHSSNPGYVPNDHWCVCDLCGLDYRMSQMMQTWDGKRVCYKDWEPRHPQETIRTKADRMAPVGIVTGQPTDSFTTVTYISDTDNTIPSDTFTGSPI